MAAKVLFIDIETAPSLGYAWQKYDTNIIEYERDWYILSFSYKWLGSSETFVRTLPHYRTTYRKSIIDDSALMQEMWRLLDEADIVVAHNGDSFDIKKINSRFLVHRMTPPSTFKTVDTLKIARKYFKFDSNKLNDLCQILGIGQKVKHAGFALWKGCMSGDKAAWETMAEYNAGDVVLLEEIYLRLRPWAANHPDVTLFGDNPDRAAHSCPNCGSVKVHRRGVAVARTRRYQRLNCQSCGSWFAGEVEKK